MDNKTGTLTGAFLLGGEILAEKDCNYLQEKSEISRSLSDIKNQLLILNGSVLKQIEKNDIQDGSIQELNAKVELLKGGLSEIEKNLTDHMDNGLSKRIALELTSVIKEMGKNKTTRESEKTQRINKFWDFMIRVVAPNGVLLAIITYLMSKGG